MKVQVLGLAYSDNWRSERHFVMVEKNRPEWMKGMLNGTGGTVLEGETPRQAVARKHREECGQDVPEADWEHLCSMSFMHPNNIMVHVFTAKTELSTVEKLTDEAVTFAPISHLTGGHPEWHEGDIWPLPVPNIPMLIKMMDDDKDPPPVLVYDFHGDVL